MIVLGFYKYLDVEDVEALALRIREFCSARDFKGSVLLGEEGVNASVSGNREEIDELKEFLLVEFGDLFFKEEGCGEHPFKKMKVKIKNEIVHFGESVNLANSGEHISSDEFLELYDSSGELKENVVVLDARNDYEFRVGHFKGAMELGIKRFREFPSKVDKLKGLEDKKIVMFCTGGIRCEKASAYLREKGFSDVLQLNQGIIQFGLEKPETVWEGKCFVFDKRMVSDVNQSGTVSSCYICGKACDFLRNCRNVECNRFYVSCDDCVAEYKKCCGKECKEKINLLRI